MIYRQLFERVESQPHVRAGVIGTGQYATAIVTQAQAISRLDVPVLADTDLEAARRACYHAGFADQDVAVCESRDAALRAIERGQIVVLPDALLMMDLPVDVIVESTGAVEGGARHALEAIRHGKHIVMVNKETDVVVGPILKHLAGRAGVVYTAPDGDQPSLLIGLVGWARELGLEVLSGGKAYEDTAVFDAAAGAVSYEDRSVSLDATQIEAFGSILPGQIHRFIEGRRAVLGSPGRSAGALAELAIVANGTGLTPDIASLHCPILRTPEIPQVLCPEEEGGILQRRGVVDALTTLRHPHEAGLGGGVFVVIACANAYSRHFLKLKGLPSNDRSSAMLIYRPYHLCGVETPISILSAALLGTPTGATDLRPRFDVVARATRDLGAGEIVSDKPDSGLGVRMVPAQPVTDGSPLPYFMAEGNALRTDVAAGSVLTTEMIVPPPNSSLWSLRARQDEHFFGA
jgi:predicted homoserine dehydrogenase-like protein